MITLGDQRSKFPNNHRPNNKFNDCYNPTKYSYLTFEYLLLASPTMALLLGKLFCSSSSSFPVLLIFLLLESSAIWFSLYRTWIGISCCMTLFNKTSFLVSLPTFTTANRIAPSLSGNSSTIFANFQKFLEVELFLSITMSPTDMSIVSYLVLTLSYDSLVNLKDSLVSIF